MVGNHINPLLILFIFYVVYTTHIWLDHMYMGFFYVVFTAIIMIISIIICISYFTIHIPTHDLFNEIFHCIVLYFIHADNNFKIGILFFINMNIMYKFCLKMLYSIRSIVYCWTYYIYIFIIILLSWSGFFVWITYLRFSIYQYRCWNDDYYERMNSYFLLNIAFSFSIIKAKENSNINNFKQTNWKMIVLLAIQFRGV